MAHGFKCKHCGQQETPHTHGARDASEAEHVNGYSFRLTTCPGFELNRRDARQQERYDDFEAKRIAWDSERRHREAWGAYMAYRAHERFESMTEEEKAAATKHGNFLIIG
jgi:hypothetical protein